MSRALHQPPYAEYAETSATIRALQEEGRVISSHVIEGGLTPSLEVKEFAGHHEIDLGPNLGRARHPLGEDRVVWIGSTLFFDPTRYEVKAEPLGDERAPDDLEDKAEAYSAEGWIVQWTSPDRIVGFRALISGDPEQD